MDLAVFGCSIAAGYGSGHEPINNYDISYPRLIANKLNVSNYYNFSIPTRSIASSKDDIIDFTENYIRVNKTTDDLFILGEMTDPKYINIPSVVGTDNKLYKPSLLVNGELGLGDYVYMYSRATDYSKVINDNAEVYSSHLLTNKELKVIITPETIDSVKGHVTSVLHDMQSPLIDEYQIYSDSLNYLCVLTDYLKKRNVRYMLMWILPSSSYSEQQFRIINKEKFNSCFDSRFVDPATASLNSITQSDNDFMGQFTIHPSEAGHGAIANFIHDYIIKFNLLEDITHARPIE